MADPERSIYGICTCPFLQCDVRELALMIMVQ